jgi:hypothetical protein
VAAGQGSIERAASADGCGRPGSRSRRRERHLTSAWLRRDLAALGALIRSEDLRCRRALAGGRGGRTQHVEATTGPRLITGDAGVLPCVYADEAAGTLPDAIAGAPGRGLRQQDHRTEQDEGQRQTSGTDSVHRYLLAASRSITRSEATAAGLGASHPEHISTSLFVSCSALPPADERRRRDDMM